MYKVIKKFSLCYGHRLYKDPGKCGHLHGHTASVEITIEGEGLDKLGIVRNFDDIKSTIGLWIKKSMDHSTILNKEDPLVEILRNAGENILAIDCNPTAENLARMVFEEASKEGLNVKRVEFYESPTSSTVFEK